ncbi:MULTISPECIES: DUF502 domain-containing protein [unclassified Lentimicrobium]|uniref:DUF502 domain-containing protein n=1 Tax=unclassified Lentimicrobium TaxID=2677434 RepID=UPI001551DA60|nr:MULTISPECIES: DUF502 domain-containing protein [unclassified Lentimicrobium]NPD44293.1 DUF502 domain-containing protein [Lentimicrobium sp. S6]NPD84602.1 DUF502 domain-containing protein [Lentimicrobium sp. L6]
MKFWKALIKYFMQGLLYLVPISVTLWVIIYAFNYLDSLVKPYELQYLGFQIPGLGLVILALLIVFIGFLGSSIIFKPLISLLENIINRAPLIKDIYSAIKDLLGAFVGSKKKFNAPVLVTMNETGLKRIGFVTREKMDNMNIPEGYMVVYLPYSYGVMGTVIVVKNEMVETINQSSTDIMKFIVSGGVTEVDQEKKQVK